MALKDVHAASKFIRIFAGNNNVSVKEVPGLKVPCADRLGNIKVPTPSIENYEEWLWHVHHELVHTYPHFAYHYDALELVNKTVPGGRRPLNVIVDNIGERYEYEKYQGRKDILCKSRYNYITKNFKEVFPEPTSREEEIILGMRVWDCIDRTGWMGYPFQTFLSPRDNYKEFLEHLEKINLEQLIEQHKTAEDLRDIVKLIMEYKGSKYDANDGEGKGSNEDEDKGSSQIPNDAGDADSDSSGSGDPSGDTQDDIRPDELSGGTSSKDDEEPSSDSVGNDTDTDNSDNSTVEDDSNDNTNDDEGTVPQGSTQDEGCPEDDGRPSGGDDSEERSPEGDNGQDGDEADPEMAAGGKGVAELPFDESKVSEAVRKSMDDYLMVSSTDVDYNTYQTRPLFRWSPLSVSPNTMQIRRVERLIGSSKVSRNIQKYLRAMNQAAYTYGCKSGKISARSLHRTTNGGTNVFKRKDASRFEKSSAVTIMIDCSLSMNEELPRSRDSKEDLAAASVSIIVDTLNALSIPCEVIGFSECKSGVVMIEFKRFSERINMSKMVTRMASQPFSENNADGEALLIGASRISLRKERNKILMVLSDGNPVGYFEPSRSAAHDYLKKVCKHIEEDTEIDLLGIGVGTSTVKQYYKNSEVVMTTGGLDKAMITLLKKRILK